MACVVHKPVYKKYHWIWGDMCNIIQPLKNDLFWYHWKSDIVILYLRQQVLARVVHKSAYQVPLNLGQHVYHLPTFKSDLFFDIVERVIVAFFFYFLFLLGNKYLKWTFDILLGCFFFYFFPPFSLTFPSFMRINFISFPLWTKKSLNLLLIFNCSPFSYNCLENKK